MRFIPNPLLHSYLSDHGLGCITTASSVKPSQFQLELDTWLVRPGSLVTGTVSVTTQETEAVHCALHSVTVSVTQGDREEVQVTSNIHQAKLRLSFETKVEGCYRISVRHNNQDVVGSPLYLPVIINHNPMLAWLGGTNSGSFYNY